MTDYIPQSYKNLRDWLQKQKDELPAKAATLGMTDAERDTYLNAVNCLLPVVSAIVDLMDELDAKTADFEPLLAAQSPILRAAIKRLKTSPACTPSLAQEMEWVGDSTDVDPKTSRPTITIEAQRGRVRIDGKKPGFEAVNLYSRIKGQMQWKLIAVRKRKFPIYDDTPLAVPGTPEVREYMAIGVVNDEEVGEPSEIKEVAYAG